MSLSGARTLTARSGESALTKGPLHLHSCFHWLSTLIRSSLVVCSSKIILFFFSVSFYGIQEFQSHLQKIRLTVIYCWC